MGGGSSKNIETQGAGSTRTLVKPRTLSLKGTKVEEPPPEKPKWRIVKTVDDIERKEELLTGTKAEAELRGILCDPVGQKYIGNFAKRIYTYESFFCFVEIVEFKNVPSNSFRKCIAKHIFQKYIRNGGNMTLGGMTELIESTFATALEEISHDVSVLHDDFFKEIERMCIVDMCTNTFVRFKDSPEYQQYKQEVKDTYNKVTVEDFDYLDMLGSGGFGRVVHARKKSTGHHYAMKIQLKTGLLDEHRGDLSKLAGEKVIFQSCNHPYIVDMHYSFQTEKHAMIVLKLVEGGDLLHAIKQASCHRLEEERVVLYAAEIALALNHIHEMGLLYRDLKPANVLLTSTGHVKLADMGLAGGIDLNNPSKLMDRDEQLMGEEEEFEKRNVEPYDDAHAERNSNVTTHQVNGQEVPAKFSKGPLARNIRRKTTVGTRGYMAPEMLKGKLKRRADRKGYNHSVDYWSLGITVFEMLCGFPPFSRHNLQQANMGNVAEFDIDVWRNPRQQTEDEIKKICGKIHFPDHMSPESISLISRLLDVNEETRMGCTDEGFLEIMSHPFFRDIDWEKLLVNHVEAKFKPKVKPIDDKAKTYSFDEIMAKFDQKDLDYENTWHKTPDASMQVHFDTWDYISPQTLKAELGIAAEIDQSNLPYKVIQLTGGIQKK